MRKKSSVNTPFLVALGVIGLLIYYIYNKKNIDYTVSQEVYKGSANILVDGVKSDWQILKSYFV